MVVFANNFDVVLGRMTMMYRVGTILALLVVVCASPVRGDLIISFTEDGTPLESIEVMVGTTTDPIPIYVFQTNGDPILTGVGLISAGVQLRYDDTGTNATATDISLASTWTDNTRTEIGSDSTGPYAAMYGAVGLLDPPVRGTAVLIGTMTFRGNVVGDETVVTAMDIDTIVPAAFNVVVDANKVGHDADVFSPPASTKIITTAVPEPSSLALALCGFAFVGAFVWKKRRGVRQ
jgi:hypothetical protein